MVTIFYLLFHYSGNLQCPNFPKQWSRLVFFDIETIESENGFLEPNLIVAHTENTRVNGKSTFNEHIFMDANLRPNYSGSTFTKNVQEFSYIPENVDAPLDGYDHDSSNENLSEVDNCLENFIHYYLRSDFRNSIFLSFNGAR